MKNIYFLIIIVILSCKNPSDSSVFFEYNEIKIHYKNIGNGSANILFIHGWGCDLNAWQHQTKYFEGKANLILVDLPGYGKSSKDTINYSIDLFAGSINALLDHLNLKEVHLVGHSLGHPIAKRIAENNPSKISSITIVDGVYFDIPEETEKKETYIQNLQGFTNMFNGEQREDNISAFIQSLYIDSTPEDIKSYTDSIMTKVPEHVGHNTMVNLILEKNWKKEPVDIPTLAVYANIPELPDNNDSLLRIWYPNLEYHEIDKAGHFVMMEKPQIFNKILEDFVFEH